MKKISLTIMVALLIACGRGEKIPNPNANADSETIVYKQDGKDFEGFIAYPKKTDKKLPAILIIHDWDGLDEYEKMRAQMLGQNGYFAFVMDMYGKGVRAKDHKEAAEISGSYGKDRKLLRSRLEKAMAVLKARPEIDPAKIFVMGYCFGGMAAIESGLMGSDIRGIITFHAALAFPTLAADAKNIRGPVLIHHGGGDKFVAEKDIKALKSEFDRAKVKYQFVVHPGATHGFTLKSNQGHAEHHLGMQYDPKADLASWASLLSFLRQNQN